MMKNTNGVSRYVDSLLYQYIITASRLYSEDVVTRPFAYNFEVFIRCNKPRHVTVFDAIPISINTLSITSIVSFLIPQSNSLLFLTSALFLLFLIPIITIASYPFMLSLLQNHWISFDSVINYLAHGLIH